MKLILNPTKPIYWDKKNKNIRCGNFPETGKEIEYEEDIFPEIFNLMKEFIEEEELEKIATEKFSIEKKDFYSVINYLLDEKFIITDKEYDKLICSEKYNRQNMYFYMLSNEIKSVDKYKNKEILILGLGGIGSIVTELLARAGFENFHIVDYDKVEKSNLIRQTAYYINDIDKYKTDALKEKIKLINTNCKIKSSNKQILEESDVDLYIKNADFVVCTLDKPARKIRRIINNSCIKYDKPVIFSGFAEHVGMIGPFVIPKKTACLECINKENSEEILDNVNITPSFGPLCSLIASIVSSEIINYYVDFNQTNLVGCTLMINMSNYSTDIIHWKRKKNCKKCGDEYDSK